MVIMEKKGVDIGYKVIYLLIGEEILVWVVNFVLMEYGIGVVMVVLGYDQCDYEFVFKYGLIIKLVILVVDSFELDFFEQVLIEKGVLFNFGEFDGLVFEVVFNVIVDKLVEKGVGECKVNYCLCDWGVFCQCYWGVLILMVILEDGIVLLMLED